MNQEDIYNQAVAMLKAGHSVKEVLDSFPNAKNELAPLLELSQTLLSMPKGIVPTPMMQRKYALSRAKIFWLSWSHTLKFAAVSSSLMLLVSAGAFTAYAAKSSLPGHSLFALKRAEEKAQLIFTIDPQAKANLEIILAQKRLTEAQQIFNNPGQNNQQSQTAALAELSDQTSTALAAAAGITQTNPQAQSNKPLLNSLEDLTRQQQSLLKQIKSNTQIQAAAQTALLALNSNSKQLSHIKQAVSVADQSLGLAQLSATSTAVAALGKISAIGNGQMTVEKIVFSLDPQTVITDNAGDKLKFSDLTIGNTVNALGTPGKDSLVATQILVTDNSSPASLATVSGNSSTSTTTTVNSSSTAPSERKVESAFTSKLQTNTNTPAATPNTDLNIATGGFIVETPDPQFHQ